MYDTFGSPRTETSDHRFSTNVVVWIRIRSDLELFRSVADKGSGAFFWPLEPKSGLPYNFSRMPDKTPILVKKFGWKIHKFKSFSVSVKKLNNLHFWEIYGNLLVGLVKLNWREFKFLTTDGLTFVKARMLFRLVRYASEIISPDRNPPILQFEQSDNYKRS